MRDGNYSKVMGLMLLFSFFYIQVLGDKKVRDVVVRFGTKVTGGSLSFEGFYH